MTLSFFSSSLNKVYRKTGFFLMILCVSNFVSGQADTTPVSSQKQAIAYLSQLKELKKSALWPNVPPALFLQNITGNITTPLSLYEGNNTNFCGYAALSYFALNEDPLTYVKFMVKLYEEGTAQYGKACFKPSAEVRQAAGTLKFKGILDIHPADQLWFLSLADHFKGYINFFDHHYNPGDENGFWASVNYAKFNRMIKTLFNFKGHARGSDLLRPHVGDLYTYIKEDMETGITVLYLNNAFLTKKKHNSIKPRTPTHYVILLGLERTNDLLTITYWDYGFRSVRQLSPAFFRKIVFGISHFTRKLKDVQ